MFAKIRGINTILYGATHLYNKRLNPNFVVPKSRFTGHFVSSCTGSYTIFRLSKYTYKPTVPIFSIPLLKKV